MMMKVKSILYINFEYIYYIVLVPTNVFNFSLNLLII